MKDYYQTLGVLETSSSDEIKKAYRTLAKSYHPDTNKSSDAENKFKEINEAYDTLKDVNKKSKYDHIKKHGSNPFGQTEWTVYDAQDAGFKDIFSSIFGKRVQKNKNEDITGKYDITLEEAFGGVNKEVIFNYQNVPKKIRIIIPPGIQSGTRLKFRGKGDDSDPRLPPGDLSIQIRIKSHSIFQRNNENLYCAVDIHVVDAIIGIETDINTIDKKIVRVKVPPGTKHDAILKVPGYGMPINGKRGILYVQIKLQVPNNITQQQKELLLKYKTL